MTFVVGMNSTGFVHPTDETKLVQFAKEAKQFKTRAAAQREVAKQEARTTVNFYIYESGT